MSWGVPEPPVKFVTFTKVRNLEPPELVPPITALPVGWTWKSLWIAFVSRLRELISRLRA